jgi:sugar phosphate isomerase/epimerase
MSPNRLTRRDFVKIAAATAAATMTSPATSTAASTNLPGAGLKLGMDNFSVRAMEWKAPQLLDHAASLHLDALLISDLDAYDSLEEPYLRDVKAHADSLGVQMYVGSWSICPTSVRFKPNRGTPEQHIATGLRVAKALGSPVLRVVLGGADDRKTPGGIEARMADTAAVLQAARPRILESGLKIAIENHAGDMQSWEVLRLIDRVGADILGVTLDAGNHVWTLEDPAAGLEKLGPHALCAGLRDNMVWETPEGCLVQWMAIGDGLIDWTSYVTRWKALCPHTPMVIETISGFPKGFPYKTPDFWPPYAEIRAHEFTQFVALAQRGHAIPPYKTPEAQDKKTADQAYQKEQLAKSVAYLRNLGVGLAGRS